MSDCRFGVSPVNYPDPDPGQIDFFMETTDTPYGNGAKGTW